MKSKTKVAGGKMHEIEQRVLKFLISTIWTSLLDSSVEERVLSVAFEAF
jgi:hypothetical protein